ncbi:efflux transporter, RND family, MFP subunit [delta proteobacterium NaphS2]|nr:efflux transporter, RND family, MFP subunit [delta proteobacterium NaphS2]
MGKTITISVGVLITLTALLVAAVVLGVMFRTYLLNPWTRDGQVQAQIIQVTPRVSGPIVELPLRDNQPVNKGDLLMKIDPRTFEAKVEQAKAALARSRASAAEAKDKLARARHIYELDKGAISRLSLVAAENALREKEASVKGALADLRSAKLDLEFTQIFAPADGYVTHLRLQTGSNTVANQPALALIDIKSFWVYGFFKETQIRYIRPGDRAVVKLMSYPDQPLEGVVASIGWGIAQKDGSTGVDLLPSVNPSFDWIRLAQRIPVVVHLKEIPSNVHLRVGTTATVIVLHPHGRLWGSEYLTKWGRDWQLSPETVFTSPEQTQSRETK